MSKTIRILDEVKVIYGCGFYLGIVPFNLEQDKPIWAKWYRYILALFCVLINFLSVYNTVVKNTVSFAILEKILSTSFVSASIYNSAKHTHKFYNFFDELDRSLLMRHNIKTPAVRHVYLKFALVQLLIFTTCTINLYVYYRAHVPWHEFFQVLFTILYTGNVCFIEFLILGHIITRLDALCIALDLVHKSHDGDVVDKVDNLAELHWILSELVYKFNEMFGWMLLLQIIYTCFSITSVLKSILYRTNDALIYAFFISYFALDAGLNISIIFKGSELECCFIKLSRKATSLLNRKANRLHLLESLKKFAEQAYKTPQITAADFFVVNRFLFLPLFALLSTFLILIAQSKINSH